MYKISDALKSSDGSQDIKFQDAYRLISSSQSYNIKHHPNYIDLEELLKQIGEEKVEDIEQLNIKLQRNIAMKQF